MSGLGKRMFASLGGFFPLNTLNKSSTPQSPPQAPPASAHSDPPAKRQKVDTREAFPTSRSQFAYDESMITSKPGRRTSMSSTQSAGPARKAASLQSSSRAAGQLNVDEFRSVERQQLGPRPKRRRFNKHSINSAKEPEIVDDSDVDLGDDDAEGVDLLHAPQHKAQLDVDPATYADRFRQKKAATGFSRPKQPRNSSPDPLAADLDYAEKGITKRRIQTSYSESRRGEIKPTLFNSPSIPASQVQKPNNKLPDNIRARSIIPNGLRIKSAVSGDYAYPDPKGGLNEPLSLCVRDVSTIMLPTNTEGLFVEDYSYLVIDLKQIHAITLSGPTGNIVSIVRPICPQRSAAAKIHLEFVEREELELFFKWISMERNEPLSFTKKILDDERLVKELRHNGSLATKSKVVRDSNVAQSQAGDDIKLIEQQREIRTPKTRQPAPGPTPRSDQRKIHDSMMPSSSITGEKPIVIPESPKAASTRATRARPLRLSDRPQTPTGWTEENPDWAQNWRNSLVFPAHGKNRATVDKDDITRLDEGQFLNDNLIIFGLRFLQDKLERQRPEIAERIHFHNTFFYDKLKPTRSGGGINYDSVKAWTSKVDLFTKDFIVVPINEHSHWYVAIVYNAPKLVPCESTAGINESTKTTANDLETGKSTITEDHSTSANSASGLKDGAALVETGMRRMSISSSNGANEVPIPDETIMHNSGSGNHSKSDNTIRVVHSNVDVEEVHLPKTPTRKTPAKRTTAGSRKHDPNQPKIITLDSLGSPHSPTCSYLRQYLVAEIKDKKAINIPDPGTLGMTAKGIPLQENYCDCGLYLLGYIKALLDDPDTFVQGLLRYEQPKWNFNSSDMRHELRQNIFSLQDEQQKREDFEKAKKQQKKRQAAEEKRSQSRPTSSRPSSIPSSRPSSRPSSSDGSHERQLQKPAPVTLPVAKSKVGEADSTGIEMNVRPATVKTSLSDQEATRLYQTMSMPGTFPAPLVKSPMHQELSESDDTTKGFVKLLKSPQSRTGTSENPAELDSSPDLTKDLQQNLDSDRKSQSRVTPRKRKPRSDADTPRRSVEQQEAASSQSSNVEPKRVKTPLRSMTRLQGSGTPLTNIAIPLPSSRLKRARDAALTQSTPTKETEKTSNYFQGNQDQEKGLRFDRSEYLDPSQNDTVVLSDTE